MDGYDAIVEADSHGSFTSLEPAEHGAWEQAGATWWIEDWGGTCPRAPTGWPRLPWSGKRARQRK